MQNCNCVLQTGLTDDLCNIFVSSDLRTFYAPALDDNLTNNVYTYFVCSPRLQGKCTKDIRKRSGDAMNGCADITRRGALVEKH